MLGEIVTVTADLAGPVKPRQSARMVMNKNRGDWEAEVFIVLRITDSTV
jgi:hypothetical protein